jgi:hypothetical protein
MNKRETEEARTTCARKRTRSDDKSFYYKESGEEGSKMFVSHPKYMAIYAIKHCEQVCIEF